jgi:hypothetical protein
LIYCVVPEALADELYDKLTAYYADDPNVTVIVDRRRGDRRGRGGERPAEADQRQVRDRRQRPPAARVPHDGA